MNTKRYIKPVTQLLTLSEPPLMAGHSNYAMDSKENKVIWQLDDEEDISLPQYNAWEDE